MDQATLHFILEGLLTFLFGGLGWLVKGFANRVSTLEKNLVEHKIEDTKQFAELHAHKEEVLRRLDSIEAKLDRLLEKK